MKKNLVAGFFLTAIILSSCGAFAAMNSKMNMVYSSIKGRVKNTADEYLAGVTVFLVNTSDMSKTATAVTAKDGSYAFDKTKMNEKYWVMTENTKDNKYLAGQLKRSVMTDKASIALMDITVSARPGNGAQYVGTKKCNECHADSHPSISKGHNSSAHSHIIMLGQKDIIEPVGGWGKNNDQMGVKTGVMASPPDGSDSNPVAVTACTVNGVKGFSFGGNTDDPCKSGVFIPIAATVGGQGDKYIMPETGKMMPNVGHFKQHFLAKLSDVPATRTDNWEIYPYPGSDKDYVMLPLYIAQSGVISPNFVPFRAIRSKAVPSGKVTDVQAFRAAGTGNIRNAWVDQGQQYSQACAGCHVVGMKITTGGKKSVFTKSFDFVEFGVGCENCHGPGSEHVSNPGRAMAIIEPSKLTAVAEREVCAKCHGLALPSSQSPNAALLYPWNDKHANDVGNGGFIAGIYKLADFMPGWATGKGFFGWDKKHGRHHKQQSYEFEQSAHVNNTNMSLTCAACHSSHSLYQGPENTAEKDEKGNVYNYKNTMFKNNTICLRCHAGSKGFKDLNKNDIALLNAGYGNPTYLNGGKDPLYDTTGMKPEDKTKIAAAQNKVASAVVTHMDMKAGMGKAVAYDPMNDGRPVGRCSTCHMPKTGMMGGYTWSENKSGEKAMVEGDVSSHAGDIIRPVDIYSMYHSAISDPTGKNAWKNVMPTSCGKCHDSGRYYTK